MLEVSTPRLVRSYYWGVTSQGSGEVGSHHRSDPPLRPASADTTLDDSHQARQSDCHPLLSSPARTFRASTGNFLFLSSNVLS